MIPLNIVSNVLVLSVVRKVLFDEFELWRHGSTGGCVRGGVLRADGDADGLG